MTKSNRRMARPAKSDASNAAAIEAKTKPQAPQSSDTPKIVTPPRVTKIMMVADLLGRSGGASIEEIVAATGWLPHTTRAALTGLKKKGHTVTKAKVDGVTRYAIAPAA